MSSYALVRRCGGCTHAHEVRWVLEGTAKARVVAGHGGDDATLAPPYRKVGTVRVADFSTDGRNVVHGLIVRLRRTGWASEAPVFAMEQQQGSFVDDAWVRRRVPRFAPPGHCRVRPS